MVLSALKPYVILVTSSLHSFFGINIYIFFHFFFSLVNSNTKANVVFRAIFLQAVCCGKEFAVASFSCIVTYAVFTLGITQWR